MTPDFPWTVSGGADMYGVVHVDERTTMNDHDLERRLREAAPATTVPSDLAERRAQVFGRGRRRRVRAGIAGGIAAVVLLGGGTVAIAGGDHMTPWGWMGDNSFTIERPAGGDCFIGMRVRWDGLAEDDPMVQDAKEILNSIDMQSLDIDDALAEARAFNETVPDLNERTEDEMRMMAMADVAARQTFEELTARGHEMTAGHEVSIASDSTLCR